MKSVEGMDCWVVAEEFSETNHEFHVFKTENDARLKFCECVQDLCFFGDYEEILRSFDSGHFDYAGGIRRWSDDVGNMIVMARAN